MVLVPRWFVVMLCVLETARNGHNVYGAHGLDAALSWVGVVGFGMSAIGYLIVRRA